MIQLTHYGITLDSLTEPDIELVRNWRNSDLVRPYMHYQGIITPEQQLNWFRNLNPLSNFYFILKNENRKIGLINIKDVNWNLKTGEAGIFIGESDYLNSTLPVMATITLMEFAFDVLRLTQLKAKMGATNAKVIEFNKGMGYRRDEYQTDNDFDYYKTDRESFYNATEKLRPTLAKINEHGLLVSLSQSEKTLLSAVAGEISGNGVTIRVV